MAQGDPRKWHMPGWRIEQKYSPGVLIGNWGEDRYTVSISCCCFYLRWCLYVLVIFFSYFLSLLSFFLSLYTARPSFEYYRQMYFVHSGLQDESLQVTISKLLGYTGVTNYRCTNCFWQATKQTILQKPINYILLIWSFILTMETNDICFKIKFNLLKT